MAAMATAETAGGVEKVLEQMEAQQALLGTCASLWRTLSAHFSSVDQALLKKTETLDAKAQALESQTEQALTSLLARESALPDLESAASARIARLCDAALAELQSADAGGAGGLALPEAVRLHCRRMDSRALCRLLAARRREAAADADIAAAVSEAVDPARLVLDAVEDFVAGIGGGFSDDQCWTVGVLLRAVFSPPVEAEGGGRATEAGWSVAERASAVAGKWKERMGEEGGATGPGEAQMFLQFVSGFGLGSRLEEEVLRNLVLRFATERDVAKFALTLGLKDKLPDMINELIKNEKEIEAIWLACGSGLTGQFPPVPLLKAFLKNLKEKSHSILKDGDYSRAATEEARNFELNSVKSIIKCVEDNKLEAEFDLHILRKRLMHLGKPKLDKNRDAFNKPTKKRGREGRGSGFGYPPSKGKRPPRHWEVRVHPNPSTVYAGSYNYPNQGVYEAPPSAPHVSPYGGLQGQSPAALTQRPHAPQEASGIGTGMAYNGAAGYGSYDYGAASAPTHTPSYQQ